MPPELENQAEETEVTTVITDEADASSEAEQSADAASSTAEDVSETDGDTLSVVRDVVGDKGEEPAAASSASEAEGQETEAEQPTEPDNENYSDVPFNKHPRFQEILGKLKTAEVDAQRYKTVETFIEEQGLSAEEAADILKIGGLMKTDPAEAWRQMQPVVQKVLIAAGEVLPEDLKTKVQSGEMSREAALEVSRNRAAMQSADARRDFERQRAETRQTTETQRSVQGAVNSWEAERRSRDPNFEAKLPAIEKEIVWLQAKEGKPNTPEGVKAQLQKAYDSVSKTYQSAAAAPAPKPKAPVRPITGGQVNGNVSPNVETALDAVKAVISRRAG